MKVTPDAALLQLSPSHLFDASLPDLLTETGVEFYESSITDDTFFGAIVQRTNGSFVLTMPPDRSELEHDTVARYLLAQAFHVDLPKLPSPLFATTEV